MRFYRALLRLYPTSYRLEYRDELCRTFADRTAHQSAFGAALSAVADVVPNAVAVHWEILRQDLTYAARSLRRTPGFAITAVLVVALGVGANTAVFSVADVALVRPLPFDQPDRLVKIWKFDWGSQSAPVNYRELREMTTSFAAMSAFWHVSANMVGRGDPRRVEMIRSTPEFFPLMGVRPVVGRVFTPQDDPAEPLLVLGYSVWQSHFGGDSRVIGTTVRLDGQPHTIIGVMPPSFLFPNRWAEAWASGVLREADYENRTQSYIEIVARLRPGISAADARRELAIFHTRVLQLHPEDDPEGRPVLMELRQEVIPRERQLVIALCGAALCVLLLACANLASLFLARGTHRARELAVRAALGAGRERLVRQLVTESLGVALIGGVVGLTAAAVGVPLLAHLIPNTLPLAGDVTLNVRALALAVVLMLLTGLAFGLAPALRAGRSSALEALRTGTRTSGGRTQRLRATLVIVEVAASVVLLVASGLLIRAIWRIQGTDTGVVADNVLTLRTNLPLPRYDSVPLRNQYFEQVLQGVRAIPGVRSAGFTTGLPLQMGGGIAGVSIPGQDPPRGRLPTVSIRWVTPQYFETLGIPLRRGRDVAVSDTRAQPFAAVVSESFVTRHWPNDDPIGRRFTVVEQERTVVGVVADVTTRGRERRAEPQVYLPYGQAVAGQRDGYMPKVLVIRSVGTLDARSLLPRIREIVHAVDPEQPISDVRPMAAIVSAETAPRLTQLRLLGALALIALLIAGLGIHGLLSFTVSKRSQELGVRRALGAQSETIVGMVLREGLALAAIGMLVGVAVGYAAARGMSALLFGVRPEDPLTLGVAALLCLLTAAIGCVQPAMRAARVDPMMALRSD
jgi:predicted permease